VAADGIVTFRLGRDTHRMRQDDRGTPSAEFPRNLLSELDRQAHPSGIQKASIR